MYVKETKLMIRSVDKQIVEMIENEKEPINKAILDKMDYVRGSYNVESQTALFRNVVEKSKRMATYEEHAAKAFLDYTKVFRESYCNTGDFHVCSNCKYNQGCLVEHQYVKQAERTIEGLVFL